jgi:hypothetical protein
MTDPIPEENMTDASRQTLTLLEMFRNDIATVADARCKVHGDHRSGGPNFTLALLSLTASEVIGTLTAPPDKKDRDVTRDFLWRVGDAVGDARYRQSAGALVAFFRNGIAHSFLPKVETFPSGEKVRGVCEWSQNSDLSTPCLEDLQRGEPAAWIAALRKRHLSVRTVVGVRNFVVAPQLLALDIDKLLAELERLLREGDQATTDLMAANYPAWEQDANRIFGKLTIEETEYLLKG